MCAEAPTLRLSIAPGSTCLLACTHCIMSSTVTRCALLVWRQGHRAPLSSLRAPCVGGVRRLAPAEPVLAPRPVFVPVAAWGAGCRGYATKKDKKAKKAKASKTAAKATFNPDEAPIDLNRVKMNLDAIVATLKEDLAKLKPGKAGPALLDTITLDMDGQQVPLNGVAQVAVKKGNTLIVSVFDPETAKATMAALEASDLGLNPVLDGNEIRVPVPK